MSEHKKPETAAALNARGMDYTSAERDDEAIAAFDRALDLEPDNAGIRYNRGEAYRRAGRSAQAQADLEAVLAAEGGAAFDIASRSFPSEAADFGAAECATGACPVSPVRKNPRDVMS